MDLEAATMAPSMRQVTETTDNISYGHKLGVSLPQVAAARRLSLNKLDFRTPIETN